jgi:hypothetical protein
MHVRHVRVLVWCSAFAVTFEQSVCQNKQHFTTYGTTLYNIFIALLNILLALGALTTTMSRGSVTVMVVAKLLTIVLAVVVKVVLVLVSMAMVVVGSIFATTVTTGKVLMKAVVFGAGDANRTCGGGGIFLVVVVVVNFSVDKWSQGCGS